METLLNRQHVAYTREIVSEHANNNPKVLEMYDKVTNEWILYSAEHPNQFQMGMLLKAVEFAAKKHEGLPRKDAEKTPYIVHPMGVAYNLWNEGGIRSVNVLTAALLHDTLEDTATTSEELEAEFGHRVMLTVQEVSNDLALDSEANKRRQVDHAPMMSMDAQLVKLADRLYNVRDLVPPPVGWSETKIEGYKFWGRALLNVLRGTNAGLEAALEQELAR